MKYTSKKKYKLKKKKLKKTKKRGGSNLSNASETRLERNYKKKFTDETLSNLKLNYEGDQDQRADLQRDRDNLIIQLIYSEELDNLIREDAMKELVKEVEEGWPQILNYFKEILHEKGNEEQLKANYDEIKEQLILILDNNIEEQIPDSKDKNEFIRLKEILIDLILKCMFNNFYIYNLLTNNIKLKVKILSDKRKLLLCQDIDEFINIDLLNLSMTKRKPFSGKLNLNDNLYAYNPYVIKPIAEFIGAPMPLRLENGNIINFTIIDYMKLILTIRKTLFQIQQNGSFFEIKNELDFFIDLIKKTNEEFEKKKRNITKAEPMLTSLKKQYRDSVVECLGKMKEKILDNIEKIAINTQIDNKFKLEDNTLENNIEELQKVQAFDIDPDGFLIEGRDDQWPEYENPSDLIIFINKLGFEETYFRQNWPEYIKQHLYAEYIPFNFLRLNSDLSDFRDWYLGKIPDDDIELYSV